MAFPVLIKSEIWWYFQGLGCFLSLLSASLLCGMSSLVAQVAAGFLGNTMTSSEVERLFSYISYFISKEPFPRCPWAETFISPFGQGRTMCYALTSYWKGEGGPLGLDLPCSIHWGQVGWNGVSFLSRWKGDPPKKIRLLLLKKVRGRERKMALKNAKH